MRIATIGRYLLGNREAILALSRDRWAVWIGLLFVLSAGFAREYDQEYLANAPGVLLIPVGASLVASFLLFQLVARTAKRKGAFVISYWPAYQSFLGLFWMTAPLAWLYAVPVERFMSPYHATQANLILLGVVSAWRVALMVRVVSVLTGCPWWSALCMVMVFGNVLALIAMFMLPTPVIAMMGGVSYSEREQLLRSTAGNVATLAIFTLPAWWIGLVVSRRLKTQWQSNWEEVVESKNPNVSTWITVTTSLLIWVPILPHTQKEQQLAYQAASFYRANNDEMLISLMGDHERADFPPAWNPPPPGGFGYSMGRLLDLTELVLTQPDNWAREAYLGKFRRTFSNWQATKFLRDGDRLRFVQLLEHIPDVEQVRKTNQPAIEQIWEEQREADPGDVGK